MSILSSWFCLSMLAQQPGPNVNMVSGTEWPGGDPFLQRQNEPSMAVSTRNPQHLLAGANDYRTVDLPTQDVLPGPMAADAWLGVFKSLDGGKTWKSTLLPGYPQDNSPVGLASPLKRYTAAADPTVRAGTHGMFYYSGISFDRVSNLGVVFVSRFMDYNNKENGDPIRYLGTVAVDRGTPGQFIDKPTIAVDIPRRDADRCSIPGAGGAYPAQSFPAGNIYLAYSIFVGSGADTRTKIMVASSEDCGATWNEPIKVNGGYPVGQGAALAISPKDGSVHLVWRSFKTSSQPDAIMYVRSTDEGDDNFTKPVPIASPINPFDQGTTETSIRTNALPTIAVDGNGRVVVAWSQRGMVAARPDEARIVLKMSTDNGRTWTGPTVADPSGDPGHKFMPALAYTAGKLSLLYYDLRLDHSVMRLVCPSGPCATISDYTQANIPAGIPPDTPFSSFISDSAPEIQVRRHTLDVRVAQADNNGPFGASAQVSQYVYGTPCIVNNSDGACVDGRWDTSRIEQLQFNVPNLPLFRNGTAPFLGDYIDIAGAPVFVPVAGTRPEKWIYNDGRYGPAIFHAVWADNRDVQPPKDGNWQNYTPPTLNGTLSTFDPSQPRPACVVGQAGMRNQNIYTSRITGGLAVTTASNYKPLEKSLKRAFVVTAQNTTPQDGVFTLTIVPGAGVTYASFDRNTLINSLLGVPIKARSSISRTVYVTSIEPNASVRVDVQQTGGNLQGSVILNPSITNPSITNPSITNDSFNPSITNPSITNPSITNPSITNPSITNPSITNPSITNGAIYNPSITNPSITNPSITNPSITNPSITNPSITNPSITNSNLISGAMQDTTWQVTNNGTAAGAYNAGFLLNGVPAGIKLQMMVYKMYSSPVAVDCALQQEAQMQVLANVNDVNSLSTASFPLAPGDSAYVTLRVVDPTPSAPGVPRFTPATDAAPLVQAQAPNAGGSTPPAAALVIPPTTLPDAVVGQSYSRSLQATGGTLPYLWSAPLNFVPGLTLSGAGAIAGTPTAAGTFTFPVTVTDRSTPQQSYTRNMTILVRIDRTGTATVLSLTSGANPSVYGRALTFTATVSPVSGGGTPTGSVGFTDGGTVLGTVPLIGSVATMTLWELPVGSHPNIYAQYGGDVNFSPSLPSNSLSITVNAPPANKVFNTGVGDNNLVLLDGAVDPHYSLFASTDTTAPGPNVFTVDSTLYPLGSTPDWLPNTNVSHWVAPISNQNSWVDPWKGSGTYTYRTIFYLADPASAILSGRWASDDGAVLKLNGVTVSTITAGDIATSAWHTFSITSGFVIGINKLEAVVINAGGPSGLRIETSGTVGPVDQQAPSNPSYGWTVIGDAGVGNPVRLAQSFTPSRPTLLAVDVDIYPGNPGLATSDTLTLRIVDAGGTIVASVSQVVPNTQNGLLRFTMPGVGVAVTPGNTYQIQLIEPAYEVFGWKYSGDTYPNGVALFYGAPWTSESGGRDFFFVTYGN